MSSGMTRQTACLSSRWDQPAQPKQTVDVRQQRICENAAVPLSGVISTASPNSTQPPQMGEKSGGVEMAAAMAAKINAMLMAKGKLLTPPPLLAKTPHSVPVPAATEEMVVTEVDINDVPLNCRDLLTKGKTQEEIRQVSGAVVSTKGHYMNDTEKDKGRQRPLYLHVQGKTQDEVNKAVMRIKEIISEDVLRASAASGGQQVPIMPPLTLYPQPPRPVVPSPVPRMPITSTVPGQGHRPAAPHTGIPQPVRGLDLSSGGEESEAIGDYVAFTDTHLPNKVAERTSLVYREKPWITASAYKSFVHTKIFVGLDQALPLFNVKEKVEGPAGSYLSHIQTETGARVFLRGKGSGYVEQASKRESFEPLYVYISHPNATGLEAAKKLTESLLETVRAEHAKLVSTYTATGSTQPYAAHGFPPNSNYSSQGSWYNYPANGYAGGYSAYQGDGGYWSNANGPPSHSNMSTNPPSSQAMVQYPVCPRKSHPYLVQDPDSSESTEPEGSINDSESPKRHFQEGAKEDQPDSHSPESPAYLEPALPTSSEETVVERFLMPPPPPPPSVAAAPAVRKRQRHGMTDDDPATVNSTTASVGFQEVECKKSKVEDASWLVPYGGDSSDEEEDRPHSSKT